MNSNTSVCKPYCLILPCLYTAWMMKAFPAAYTSADRADKLSRYLKKLAFCYLQINQPMSKTSYIIVIMIVK